MLTQLEVAQHGVASFAKAKTYKCFLWEASKIVSYYLQSLRLILADECDTYMAAPKTDPTI